MREFRYPSIEEIHAVERAARRERAEEVARLARSAVTAIRGFFSRNEVALKEARHA